jgi:hypothetical protein
MFPVPFLYSAACKPLAFKDGVLWAGLTVLLHLSGGISVVMRMSGDYWLFGLALSLAVVFYLALVCGMLCWAAQKMLRLLRIEQVLISRIIAYTGVLIVFITWIDRYCLFIFDRIEGYPLMHPIILLTHCPSLLLLLPCVGKLCMTGLFFLVSGAFVGLLVLKNIKSLFFFILVLVPWVLSIVIGQFQQEEHTALWVPSVVAIARMTSCKSSYPESMMRVMGQFFSAIVKNNPAVRIIVLPESAFDSQVFLQNPQLFKRWGQESLGQPVHIIFGGVRKDNELYYNSLYWVYDGVLCSCFDKKHAMVLSERLPRVCDTIFTRSVYFNNSSVVTCGRRDRSLLKLEGIGEFMPYLCSELFFNEYPDDTQEKVPIIALINDSVFKQHSFSLYIQDLLLSLARFKAVMWHRDIVYVSYAYTVFLNKKGEKITLPQG